MGYQQALEAAGAEILNFKEFGSYQGTWWAKVKFENKIFWVQGWYGSCSGCDAFEAEFDYDDGHCDIHSYEPNDQIIASCEYCKELTEIYNQRLKEFGLKYLNDPFDQEQAEKEASQDDEWDMEAAEMIKFIKNNKI